MTHLFGRKAKLLIGKPGNLSLSIENLRVKFSIQKTSESTANSAIISVFNLNPLHRGMVENEGLALNLQAGYTGIDGENPLIRSIYWGDIFRAATERQGPDIVTTFECKDGGQVLRRSSVNISFKAGTTRSQVIDYLVQQMASKYGLSYKKYSFSKDDQYVNGIALFGNTKDYLDTILPNLGLRWSIQDNEIFINDPETKDIPGAVLVSKNTGMIGIPVKREKGLEVTSLLNPLIRPGKTIKVVSEQTSKLNGAYIVERADYEGDTLEGDWTVKVEAL